MATEKETTEYTLLLNAQQLLKELRSINAATSQTGNSIDNLRKKVVTLETATDSGAKKIAKSFDGMRIAMSIFAYDLIRNGLQAVQQFFSQAIDQARQLEATLYRLKNAERILSQGGSNVTMEGFRQGIKDIKALLPIFSNEDISQMVGAIAVATKELGFTEQQILDLAKAAAIYNVQSVENETLLQSQAKLVTALISPTAKSIGSYGIAFSKVTMEAKALELGILKVGESVAKLTDQQKAQVKYAIIMEGANANIASLNGYLETNTAKLEKNKAAWKDLLTTIGQVILPFIPAVTAFLNMIQNGINGTKVLIALWASLVKTIQLLVTNAFGFARAILTGKASIKDLVDYAKFAFEDLRNQWLRALFPDIPANAPKFLKGWFEAAGVGEFEDTPTGQVVPDVSGQVEKEAKATQDAMEDLQDIMRDNADKLVDIAQDYQNKIQDIEMDGRRKFADIAKDRARDLEDAERDYQQSIADIEQESAESQQEARLEYQRSEEDAEREHQDRLAELREKYLMDLEEALHERDARQILRLMRQYQIDRNNTVQERQRDRQNNQAELQQTLQDLEVEKQEKLRKAREELEEKRAEIELNAKRERQDAAIAQGRALQDARIAHNRALAEQREYLQRKLRDLADAIQAEYNMTAQGAQAMINLMSATYQTLSNMSYDNGQQLGTPGSSTGNLFTSATPVVSSTWAAGGLFGTGGLAEGGSFLATTPTSINVAETRPELITATPLGKPGRDVGKLFSNMAEGGMGGSMEIALTLSPDLEARIVRNSMDATANAIVRINRSKVR